MYFRKWMQSSINQAIKARQFPYIINFMYVSRVINYLINFTTCIYSNKLNQHLNYLNQHKYSLKKKLKRASF